MNFFIEWKYVKKKKNSNSNVLYSFYYTYKEETLKSKYEMQITTYTYLFRPSIRLIYPLPLYLLRIQDNKTENTTFSSFNIT